MRLPIELRHVWEGYHHVRLNQGSHGVDQQDWTEFDARLYHHLYKLWNRLSSGSYFPQAVRRVYIPKTGGVERPLGIPTISDRIVQEVLRRFLEPYLEPLFHADSYGYRRGRGAHDALAACRSRTDYYILVVDVDIKGYFDSIPHDRLMHAVKHYCPQLKWLHLYIERILQASVQLPDGQIEATTCGVPQGGVISPLLSNLYLHVVFDAWIGKQVRAKFSFERYADDIVVHTVSEQAAAYILRLMGERFKRCGLTLHPEKTKLVCTDLRKDVGCKRDCITSFTFLGHKFHRKMVRVKKQSAVQLLYQVSIADKSRKRMLEELKALQLHRRTLSLEGMAMLLKAKVRGWVAYYGKYARTAMHRIYAHINYRLVKWCMCKYRKFKGAALRWLRKRWERHPRMLVHWQQTPWFCYPFKGEQIGKQV